MICFAEVSGMWLARGMDLLVVSGDAVFGWLLALPRDAALLTIVAATILLTLAARRCCADQDRLRRCVNDLRMLKTLKRAARQAGMARAERMRFEQTAARVRLIQLWVDLRVLSLVIVPLLWLATWASVRFDYEPLVPGRVYTLTARLPLSSAGRVAHLVPEPWFAPETSLITRAAPDPALPGWSRADWRVRFAGTGQAAAPSRQQVSQALTIRHGGESATHPVFLDGRRPSPAVVPASDASTRFVESRLDVAEYRFLGVVPGWTAIGLAPWVVAYLLLSVLGLPIVKRVTRTY